MQICWWRNKLLYESHWHQSGGDSGLGSRWYTKRSSQGPIMITMGHTGHRKKFLFFSECERKPSEEFELRTDPIYVLKRHFSVCRELQSISKWENRLINSVEERWQWPSRMVTEVMINICIKHIFLKQNKQHLLMDW